MAAANVLVEVIPFYFSFQCAPFLYGIIICGARFASTLNTRRRAHRGTPQFYPLTCLPSTCPAAPHPTLPFCTLFIAVPSTSLLSPLRCRCAQESTVRLHARLLAGLGNPLSRVLRPSFDFSSSSFLHCRPPQEFRSLCKLSPFAQLPPHTLLCFWTILFAASCIVPRRHDRLNKVYERCDRRT
jgi:hypothetical protein